MMPTVGFKEIDSPNNKEKMMVEINPLFLSIRYGNEIKAIAAEIKSGVPRCDITNTNGFIKINKIK